MEKISAAEYEAFCRFDFYTFMHRAFLELNPRTLFSHNWHNELVAAKLEALLRGEILRLIINVPPRSLKSHGATVAFPAYVLGHHPSAEIICASYRPTNILVEDKASGTQLIQELIRAGVYGVTRYEPRMDKIMRLHSVTSMIENGFVYLPSEAGWLAAYLHELTVFPNGKHDDQADSTSQALDWAKQYPARLPMEEFHKRQLLRLKLGLPEEYIFKQCDEGEEIIAESIRTGERIRWNGHYWEKCN